MKGSSLASTVFLLAGLVAAAPSPQHAAPFDAERAAARIMKFREGNPVLRNGSSISDAADSNIVTYNWGGAQSDNTGVTGVSASLNVPSVTFPAGFTPNTSEEYYGCAWVGISGLSGCNGLWQGGAYWEARGGGAFSYHAFYEWYPANPVFTSLEISPGDTLSVKIVAATTTSGTITMTNARTKQSVSKTLSGQTALCETTAEWIVEENVYSENEFTDFKTVTFNDAAYTAHGVKGGVANANIYVLQNNGHTWTNCHTSGSSTVVCNWQSAST